MADAEPHPEGESHEAIHLPPPSIWPVVVAIAIALILTGLIINLVVVIAGAVIGIAGVALWIRDARHELQELPE
jgi:uncharacterized membrane protein